MAADYEPLAQNVEMKFQDWFEDPVPAEAQPLAEADHSIGNHIPANPPITAKENHLHHRTQKKLIRKRHAGNSTELVGLLFFGIMGAVSLGVTVGIFISILEIVGLYSDYWPSQFSVIATVTILGFSIGLSGGYGSLKR